MKKKQILFVIDSLNCGGAERSLVSLLPLLDYDKMEVDLLIVSRGGLFEQYLPRRYVSLLCLSQTAFGSYYYHCVDYDLHFG